MLTMPRFDTRDPEFHRQLRHRLAWENVADPKITATVRTILEDVKQNQDEALLAYTARFDRLQADSVAQLQVSTQRIQQALHSILPAQRQALEQAAQRIIRYHEKQKQSSWQYTEADGTMLGQQITPLDRVGLYVPGGKAAYPSSVLMNALPAKVAGVTEIVMVVPAPDGVLNDMVLAAAAIAGVDQIFTIGGAQAVAALAYGTPSIPKVDKIVGPGNIYVAVAKSMVVGTVGIDMIAGPSEILVICDGDTDPDWIAMDLFSQAEHDEQAQSILISPNPAFLDQVQIRIENLLPTLPRADIIRASLTGRGFMILVRDLIEAAEVANQIAPEHLELSIAEPQALLPHIRHAGAIFLGRYTAEALGDYCAGPNHVLPTSGSARFSSPLGVYDFQKRSSLIFCSASGAFTLGNIAVPLAEGEGLQAHAESARLRTLSAKAH